MEPDLPLTKGLRGLQQEELDIEPILEQRTTYPLLEREPVRRSMLCCQIWWERSSW
jgi:hypothetical protein